MGYLVDLSIAFRIFILFLFFSWRVWRDGYFHKMIFETGGFGFFFEGNEVSLNLGFGFWGFCLGRGEEMRRRGEGKGGLFVCL